MPNHPTTTGTGPWHILVLDRDPALDDVTAAWATATGLYRPALTRLRHADVWRIDEQPQEN
jgi:hypothetical protein